MVAAPGTGRRLSVWGIDTSRWWCLRRERTHCGHGGRARPTTTAAPVTPRWLWWLVASVIALEILRFAAGRDAYWLALSGRTITPDEARQAGLVDEVVAAAELLPRASVIARQLAAIDPENFAMAKRQLRAEALQRVEQARDADARAMEIWKAPGTHAAIRAYLDKTVKRG